MNPNLDIFVIEKGSSILKALKKIDVNKKGFLVVLCKEQYLGTLTDGDIRRAFINGKKLEDSIDEVYKYHSKTINPFTETKTIIELFKNEEIKFLPVVDQKGFFVNLITKSQLHVILMQNKEIKLEEDYTKINDNIIDFEIYGRPWGYYKTTAINDFYQSKIICVYPEQKLSLQSHNRREEHWTVVHGDGIVQIGDSKFKTRPGDVYFIPKGCKHRLENVSDKENLVITEVQVGDYFGEDDIYRYQDAYGR